MHEATCPAIAVLDVQDRDFINEAAKRGIFAYIANGHDPQEMQSAIDIVLRRFAEYHALEGAFGRRAVTERAKGILMERHDIDEQAASRSSAIRRAAPIANSWTSPMPSWRAVRCSRLDPRADRGDRSSRRIDRGNVRCPSHRPVGTQDRLVSIVETSPVRGLARSAR